MKPSRWRPPSPALVIACLALFVALGGTVLAATKINGKTIAVKSLPGNRLEVGSLPGNRLKAGTIPGSRIAPRSLKGGQIDVASLGKVPDAAHADAADVARHAQTATAADHAADATTVNGRTAGCAAGDREFAGACWDLQPSTTKANAPEAASACAARGGELPDFVQFLVFVQQPGVAITAEGEWTGSEKVIGLDSWAMPVVKNGTHFEMVEPKFLNHFRCVTPLLS